MKFHIKHLVDRKKVAVNLHVFMLAKELNWILFTIFSAYFMSLVFLTRKNETINTCTYFYFGRDKIGSQIGSSRSKSKLITVSVDIVGA